MYYYKLLTVSSNVQKRLKIESTDYSEANKLNILLKYPTITSYYKDEPCVVVERNIFLPLFPCVKCEKVVFTKL